VPEEAAIRAFIAELEQQRGGRAADAFDESRLDASAAPPASERDGDDVPDEPDPGAFDESRLGVSIAPPDPRRDEPDPGAFDESRLGVSIAPPVPRRDEPEPGGFDESWLAPSIADPEPARDHSATSREPEEEPVEAHGQIAPGGPAASGTSKRRVWAPWTWGRK
jgi:hypothetical protein